MSIQKLVSSFNTGCWIPSAKALVVILKTLDKKITNFQLYFNTKKYNSTNKVNFTDKERYDTLVKELIQLVKTEDVLKPFVVNFDNWTLELESCLKSEQVYNLVSCNFLKGSYAKMIDDLNRLLIPKNTDDDDDTTDPTENLKLWVKNYSQDFDIVLDSCVKSGFLLYKSVHDTADEDPAPVSDQMLNLKNPVFSIYSMNGPDKILALWVSDKKLEFEFESIDLNEYISLLTNPTNSFNLNPEHQTNMDTIKRNYINKQTDLFKSHVSMLVSAGTLYFYKANYLHSGEYDAYSELQFSNAINSFPLSFEDYTKNAFALFYFNKGEKVTVSTYWITSKPIEQVLSIDDKALFNWVDSDCGEFLSASISHVKDDRSILH
jgi:hypothetical protein